MTMGYDFSNKYSYLMFGYNNIKEFKESLLGKWYKEFLFTVVCIFLTFWFGMDSIMSNINENIFSPASAFAMALVTIVADWFSGMYRSWHKGEFSTKKAQRILPKLLANAVLLGGYFHFHKHLIVPLHIDLLTNVFETGKVIVAAAMAGIHSLSFISNSAEAELINGKLAEWIKEKVDVHKSKVDKLI